MRFFRLLRFPAGVLREISWPLLSYPCRLPAVLAFLCTMFACAAGAHAANINISGTAYASNRTAPITGTTMTVQLKINGGGSLSTTTNSGDGTFSFTGVSVNSGDALLFFIDGSGNEANTITVTDGSTNISGLPLYESHVALRSDNGATAITLADLTGYDDDDEADDLLFTANGGVLDVEDNRRLMVVAGSTFAPGGAVVCGSLGLLVEGTWQTAAAESITSDGIFDLRGGVWNATSETVTLNPNGNRAFYGDGNTIANIRINVNDGVGASVRVDFQDAVTITGTLTLDYGLFNAAGASHVELHGDVAVSASFGAASTSNDGILYFTGSGAQSITCANGGVLPLLNIDKPSGTLTFASDFSCLGITKVQGTVDAGTSRVRINEPGTTAVLDAGSGLTLYDLEVDTNVGVTQYQLDFRNQIIVSNDLILTSGRTNQSTNGDLHVRGDITVSSVFGVVSGGNDVLTRIDGTGAQSITSSDGGTLPPLIIDKASGTLTLASDIVILGLTYVQGTVAPGLNTVTLREPGTNVTLTAAGLTLYNFVVNTHFGSTQRSCTVVGALNVTHDLTLNGGLLNLGASGEVRVGGDVEVSELFGSASTSNDCPLVMAGSGAQSITVASGGICPPVHIDCTGTVTLASQLDCVGMTYIGGTFNHGSRKVILREPGASATLDGGAGLTLYQLEIAANTFGTQRDVNLYGVVTVTDTLTLTDGRLDNLGGDLRAEGNVFVAAAWGLIANDNDGLISFVGSAAQTVTFNNGAVLPGVTLNKTNPTDTVTVVGSGTFELREDLTLTQGILDLTDLNLLCNTASTFTSNNNATLRMAGDQTVQFLQGGGFDTSQGTVEFNGASTYTALPAGFGGDFYRLTFSGSGGVWNFAGSLNVGSTGATVDVADNFKIAGSATVSFGGNVTVASGGSFLLEEAATLQLGDASTMQLDSGSAFSAAGAGDAQRVTVTKRPADAGDYTFNCDGNFSAAWYRFQHMDAGGIDLTGATIAAGGLDNGAYDYGTNNSPLLKLSIASGITVTGCAFDNSGGLGSPKNVSNLGVQSVLFYPSGGALGGIANGESYDDLAGDGLIFWVPSTARFWVGGAGNWSDATNHWAVVSGGAPGAGNLPTASDVVIFDANSFLSGGQTLTLDAQTPDPVCADMLWSLVTNAPTLAFSDDLDIHGSLELDASMTLTNVAAHAIDFLGDGDVNTLTSAGHALGTVSHGGSGTLTLQDDFSCGAFTLSAGTFSLGSHDFVTAGNAVFSGGSFAGGSGAVTFDGGAAATVTISGAAFTSTSGVANVKCNLTYTSGSFAHNGGTVIFNASANTAFAAGGLSLNTMQVDMGAANVLSQSGTATVLGVLTLTEGAWSGGSVNLAGDLAIATTFGTAPGSNPTVVFNGTGAQSFTGAGSATLGVCPAIQINKASGTLTLASTIRTAAPWTRTAGTVDPGASTLLFVNSGAVALSGTNTFHNFTVNGSATLSLSGGSLTVNNNLTITAGTLNAAGQAINVGGNWSNTGAFTAAGNVVTFFGGAASTLGSDNFAALTVNKTAAVVTLTGTLNVGTTGATVDVSGDLNVTGGTLAVSGAVTVGGSSSLTVDDATAEFAGNVTVASGGALDITGAGTMRLSDASQVTINSGGSFTLTGDSDAVRAAVTKRIADVGDYGFDCNGDFSAQYYIFEYMDVNGVDLRDATIAAGGLDRGRFDYGTDGAPLLRLNLSSGITVSTCVFDNSGGLSTPYNVANHGSAVAEFTPSGGSLGGSTQGEVYDGLVGDAFITWGAGLIAVSGTAYSSNGVTPLTGAARAVRLYVNGATLYSTSTNSGTGAFAFSDIDVDGGDTITILLYNEAERGNVVTITNGFADITAVPLIDDRVVLRSDRGSEPITILDLVDFDDDQDSANMLFDADAGSPNTLSVENNIELLIPSGEEFKPGGNVTTLGGLLNLDGIWTAAGTETVTLNGNFSATGGAWTPANGTVEFVSTSSRIWDGGGITLYNLRLNTNNGSGTERYVSLNDTAYVTGALTLDYGRLNNGTGSVNTLFVRGSVTGTAPFGANTSDNDLILTFDGTGAQSITLGAGGILPRIKVAKSSGTLTFASDIGCTGFEYVSGTVAHGSKTLILREPATTCTLVGNNISLYALEFDTGVQTCNVNGVVNLAGSLVLTSGRINEFGGSNIKVAGDVTLNASYGSNTTANDALITLTGSAAQTLTAAASAYLPALAVNKTNVTDVVTVAGGTALLCNEDLTLTRGVLSLAGNGLTCTTTSTFTSNNNATLRLQGTETVQFLQASGFDESKGRVEFAGSGAYSVPAGFGGDFYNVLISGTGTCTVSGVFNLGATGGALDVANAMTLTAGTLAVSGNVTLTGGTLTLSGDSEVTVGGTWTNDATFSAGTGGVTFNGATTPVSVTGGTPTGFYNLTLDKSAQANTLRWLNASTVTGRAMLTSGTLDVQSGSWTVPSGATLRSTPSGSSWPTMTRTTGNFALTVASGGTVNVSGLNLRNLDGTGMDIQSGAVIENMKRVDFRSPAGGATQHLRITTTAMTRTFPELYFDDNTTYNVTAVDSNGGNDTFLYFQYADDTLNGPGAGEDKDNDDDADENGAGDGGGAVVLWLSNVQDFTDGGGAGTLGGQLVGFPVFGYDFGTFSFVSIYAVFNDYNTADDDILYAMDENGLIKYEYVIPSANGDVVNFPLSATFNEMDEGYDVDGVGGALDERVHVVYLLTDTGRALQVIDDLSSMGLPGAGSDWNTVFYNGGALTEVTSNAIPDPDYLLFGGKLGGTNKVFGLTHFGKALSIATGVGSQPEIRTTPAWRGAGPSVTHVYFGSDVSAGAAHIYRLNTNTLTVDEDCNDPTNHVRGSISIRSDIVYGSDYDGFIHKINENQPGFEQPEGWPVDTGAASPIRGGVSVVSGGFVYAANDNGTIFKFNAAGELDDNYPITPAGGGATAMQIKPLVVGGTTIWIGDVSGRVYKIDAASAAVLGMYHLDSAVTNIGVNVQIGKIMVGTASGNLYFLD